MAEKKVNNVLKIFLVTLLHIFLVEATSFVGVIASSLPIFLVLGLVMSFAIIVLPLYLLSIWNVTWRALKIALIILFISDCVIAFYPYIYYLLIGSGLSISQSVYNEILRLVGYGLLNYGLAYYIIHRQEQKQVDDDELLGV